MFELIAFGILLVVLLGALGLPYPQRADPGTRVSERDDRHGPVD